MLKINVVTQNEKLINKIIENNFTNCDMNFK